MEVEARCYFDETSTESSTSLSALEGERPQPDPPILRLVEGESTGISDAAAMYENYLGFLFDQTSGFWWSSAVPLGVRASLQPIAQGWAVDLGGFTTVESWPDLERGVAHFSTALDPARLVVALSLPNSESLLCELDEIERMIAENSVEDGCEHPAESKLGSLLGDSGQAVREILLSRFRSGDSRTQNLPDLLRLLGRQPISNVPTQWLRLVVEHCLDSPDAELRDAAVQSVELHDDSSLCDVLERHDERVPWLADYVQRVIRDLSIGASFSE